MCDLEWVFANPFTFHEMDVSEYVLCFIDIAHYCMGMLICWKNICQLNKQKNIDKLH